MTTVAPTPIFYNELITKVQGETENTSAELLAQLPQIVHDAELALLRALDIQNLHVYADSNFLSAGTLVNSRVLRVGETAYITLPNDCEIVRYLMVFLPVGIVPSQDNLTDQYNGAAVNLIRVDETFIQNWWPQKSQTGTPKYYAILGSTKDQAAPNGQLLVAPTPAQNYAIRLAYVTRPDSLIDQDPNTGATYLSTWYPDLLFYATMVRCGAFMKTAEQLQMWGELFTAAVSNSQKMEARKKGQSYADVSPTTIPLPQRQQ